MPILKPSHRCNVCQAVDCQKHKEIKSPRNRQQSNRYSEKPYRRARATKLNQSPLCEDCLDKGRTTAATEIHHTHKVRDRPDLFLNLNEAKTLCKSCHSKRTKAGE